jgi:hypothetical protein
LIFPTRKITQNSIRILLLLNFQAESIQNSMTPGISNPKSQYFILLFNKISWLCKQQLGEDETSNGGLQLKPNMAWLYG